MSIKNLLCVMPLLACVWASPVLADDEHAKKGNQECPVGLVSGMTLDEEFGLGSQGLTQCIKHRNKVKVVVQINQFCASATPNAACTRPYALGNITNIINDYEITHGMVQGRDYEIVAVIHSGAGFLALTNEGYNGNGDFVSGRNQFEGAVKTLMDKGVKFYFCQNTTRGYIANNILPAAGETAGGATAELIPGMNYTTAGVSSIVDYQRQGYRYIQP
ncbi:MAG: DsrE family protein [Gammaproteobacteria bacterium]